MVAFSHGFEEALDVAPIRGRGEGAQAVDGGAFAENAGGVRHQTDHSVVHQDILGTVGEIELEIGRALALFPAAAILVRKKLLEGG